MSGEHEQSCLERLFWWGVQLLIFLYALWFIVYLGGRQAMEGKDHGLVASLHNIAPWFGPIGLGLLVVALFSQRRWLFVILLAPGLIAFSIWFGPLLWPPPDVTAPPNSHIIHAATFNILSPNSDPDRIPDAIRELGTVDIIGLQELGADHAAAIEADVSDLFPYRVLVPGKPTYMGVGLLSRYPIMTHELYQPVPDSMYHLRAELDVEGIPVIVYVIHPFPPKNRGNPFRYDNSNRDTEIDVTLQRVEQEDGAVLLLCDCNMPDQSVEYDVMNHLLDDAFREVGWGMGFTFPAFRAFIPSLIRIDYVWYNDHFVALSAETAANPGTSDHRPVQATLALKPPVE